MLSVQRLLEFLLSFDNKINIFPYLMKQIHPTSFKINIPNQRAYIRVFVKVRHPSEIH